tara:strand:- start:1079 stop:1327 length:249 start_codon:yes stop_codon:yes gene_type:complete
MAKKEIDKFFSPRSDFFKIPSESERILKEIYTTNKLNKQRTKRWLYSSIVFAGLSFVMGLGGGYILANRNNQTRSTDTLIIT